MKKTILIVLHKHDSPLQNSCYVIKYFIQRWAEQGYTVLSANGTDKKIDADIVINHVDLTVTPSNYIRYFSAYNKKINTDVTDISKTAVSNCILKPGASHAGPVIVKTNNNCGGLREENMRMRSRSMAACARKITSVLSNRIKKAEIHNSALQSSGVTPSNCRHIDTVKNWNHVTTLDNRNYPIFDSVHQVPAGVWNNEALVVERFMPERDAAGNYVCRYLYFLGDKSFCVVTTSENPVAKSQIIGRQILPGPGPVELQQFRRTFRMDYGRLDYTLVDGRVWLFDANRTPTFSPETYATYREQIDALSEGIHSFF